MEKETVKFISYDGHFPNLCAGNLVISVNGKLYSGIRINSGGRVWFDADWRDHLEQGLWYINDDDLPKELIKYKDQIEKVVNENVPLGCCGGCI